jgi:hypothetical protein
MASLVGLPWVKVAGSAALFVERCLANRDPGFTPGDIDVWAEGGYGVHPDDVGGDTTGVWPDDPIVPSGRSVAGLLSLYEQIFVLEVYGDLRVSTHEAPIHEAPIHEAPIHEAPIHEAPIHEAPTHEAPTPDSQTGPPINDIKHTKQLGSIESTVDKLRWAVHHRMARLGRYNLRNVVVSFRGGLQIRIQVIFQPTDDISTCDCDYTREGCIKCIAKLCRTNHDVNYPDNCWRRGMPQHRFDIDASCVALDRCPRTNNIIAQRLCGSRDGPELNIRASAIWRLKEDPLTERSDVVGVYNHASLENRIKKYRARGYTRITVADSMIIHGQACPTPDWVLKLCQRD